MQTFFAKHMGGKEAESSKLTLPEAPFIDLTIEETPDIQNTTDTNLTPKKRKRAAKKGKKRKESKKKAKKKKKPEPVPRVKPEGPLPVSDFDFDPSVDAPHKPGQAMSFEFVAKALEELEQ